MSGICEICEVRETDRKDQCYEQGIQQYVCKRCHDIYCCACKVKGKFCMFERDDE